jgi:hypothetical protein
MAVIHHTSLTPSKLDLLARWLPDQQWFDDPTGDLDRAGGFRLDDPNGEVGIEFMVVRTGAGTAYAVPMAYRGAPLDGADEALIGTSLHGVLGMRWIYDGERDPVVRAQLAALLRGEAAAQSQDRSGETDPSVQVWPAADEATVRLNRRLHDGDAPPAGVGYVSAQWQRRDGSTARSVIATAG